MDFLSHIWAEEPTMGRPPHHRNNTATSFRNPWPSASSSLLDIRYPAFFRLNPFSSEPSSNNNNSTPKRHREKKSQYKESSQSSGSDTSLPSSISSSESTVEPIKVVDPDFTTSNELCATWLGHASFLVRFPQTSEFPDGVNVLFDPIFSDRASPIQSIGFRRFHPPPCTIEDLPHIHFVVISHNHYDHLDYDTIMALYYRFQNEIRFIAPLGNKNWFENCGIPPQQVFELDWWNSAVFSSTETYVEESTVFENISKLEFHCVPAQHSAGRVGWDNIVGNSLWGGWVVKFHRPGQNSQTVYHAGDTGYRSSYQGPVCPAFKEIGERLGPMDLSMIPIWRGGGLSFLSWMGVDAPDDLLMVSHCPPGDALEIHCDVKSRSSLAMHFATFTGTSAEAIKPLYLLSKAKKEKNIRDWNDDGGGMSAIDIGQTAIIKTASTSNHASSTTLLD